MATPRYTDPSGNDVRILPWPALADGYPDASRIPSGYNGITYTKRTRPYTVWLRGQIVSYWDKPQLAQAAYRTAAHREGMA